MSRHRFLILIVLLLTICMSACFGGGTSSEADAAVSDATISDAATDVADIAVEDAADATVEDTTPDTEQDTGPCNGGCSTDAYCDTTTDSCVACLDDTHCPGGLCADDNTCVECFADDDCAGEVSAFACDTENNECVECVTDDHCAEGVCAANNECVECLADDDCSDPTAAACDTTDNKCVACADDAACSNVGDTNLCDTSGGAGVCVECTVDDESACGNFSCDPATNTCTQTPTGTIDTCMPCKADSECVADHRCVEMNFNGTTLADGYCLKTVSSGCTRPYGGVIISRESLSGESLDDYCGIDETLTSCSAIHDFAADTTCSAASDCGLSGHDDGRCERVGAFNNRCTYTCSVANQCPTSSDCASLPGSSDYCGGGA